MIESNIRSVCLFFKEGLIQLSLTDFTFMESSLGQKKVGFNQFAKHFAPPRGITCLHVGQRFQNVPYALELPLNLRIRQLTKNRFTRYATTPRGDFTTKTATCIYVCFKSYLAIFVILLGDVCM